MSPVPVVGRAPFGSTDPLANTAPALLEVTGLSVCLGATQVLSDVTFTVNAGERVGLIGESGSGKSVTALAVIGLLPEEMSATGQVCFGGEQLMATSERRRSELRGNRLSMVFQEPMSALNPLMRVGKQVGEVLRIHRGLGRAGARARAVELLARVGLDDPEHQARAFPHQLSGGQRQRVMLAMAVACGPSLVLADEPTTALDVTVQAQVLAVLRQLVDEEQSSLVLISHDLAVVSSLCERLLVMYGGRIVESGTTAELLATPRHPYTAGLVATSGAVSPDRPRDGKPLPAIAGTVPELGQFPQGCVFRSRCDRADGQCELLPVLEGDGHQVACWHPQSHDASGHQMEARVPGAGAVNSGAW